MKPKSSEPSNGEGKARDYEGGLIIIPAGVMRLAIPLQAKVIFGAIWAIVQMKAHKCWMANWRLAEMVGTKPNSRFKLNLQILEQSGLIDRVWDAKSHREEIRVTWNPSTVITVKRPAKRGPPPSTFSGPPPSTKSGGGRVRDQFGGFSEMQARETKDASRIVSSSSPQSPRVASARRKTADEIEAERRRQLDALARRFPKDKANGNG